MQNVIFFFTLKNNKVKYKINPFGFITDLLYTITFTISFGFITDLFYF